MTTLSVNYEGFKGYYTPEVTVRLVDPHGSKRNLTPSSESQDYILPEGWTACEITTAVHSETSANCSLRAQDFENPKRLLATVTRSEEGPISIALRALGGVS